MHPILCVTEFTDLTREAAAAADALASRAGEPVHLVHSVDEREQFAFNLRERLVEPDCRRLTAEARELRQPGFDFREVILRGMPEDGIAAYAWRTRARLIVAGCLPAARVEHWALGCIAEEISETSLVPVLAVRCAVPVQSWLGQGRPMKVLAAFAPAARPDALLHRLDELRQMADCLITTALVRDPESKTKHRSSNSRHDTNNCTYRDLLRNVAEELSARDLPTMDLTTERHDSADTLVQYARKVDADLLVVATHPRDDLTVLPHRALAHGVLRRAPMNVLCVPESDVEPPRPLAQTHAATPPHSAPFRGAARIHLSSSQENS